MSDNQHHKIKELDKTSNKKEAPPIEITPNPLKIRKDSSWDLNKHDTEPKMETELEVDAEKEDVTKPNSKTEIEIDAEKENVVQSNSDTELETSTGKEHVTQSESETELESAKTEEIIID